MLHCSLLDGMRQLQLRQSFSGIFECRGQAFRWQFRQHQNRADRGWYAMYRQELPCGKHIQQMRIARQPIEDSATIRPYMIRKALVTVRTSTTADSHPTIPLLRR